MKVSFSSKLMQIETSPLKAHGLQLQQQKHITGKIINTRISSFSIGSFRFPLFKL